MKPDDLAGVVAKEVMPKSREHRFQAVCNLTYLMKTWSHTANVDLLGILSCGLSRARQAMVHHPASCFRSIKVGGGRLAEPCSGSPLLRQ